MVHTGLKDIYIHVFVKMTLTLEDTYGVQERLEEFAARGEEDWEEDSDSEKSDSENSVNSESESGHSRDKNAKSKISGTGKKPSRLRLDVESVHLFVVFPICLFTVIGRFLQASNADIWRCIAQEIVMVSMEFHESMQAVHGRTNVQWFWVHICHPVYVKIHKWLWPREKHVHIPQLFVPFVLRAPRFRPHELEVSSSFGLGSLKVFSNMRSVAKEFLRGRGSVWTKNLRPSGSGETEQNRATITNSREGEHASGPGAPGGEQHGRGSSKNESHKVLPAPVQKTKSANVLSVSKPSHTDAKKKSSGSRGSRGSRGAPREKSGIKKFMSSPEGPGKGFADFRGMGSGGEDAERKGFLMRMLSNLYGVTQEEEEARHRGNVISGGISNAGLGALSSIGSGGAISADSTSGILPPDEPAQTPPASESPFSERYIKEVFQGVRPSQDDLIKFEQLKVEDALMKAKVRVVFGNLVTTLTIAEGVCCLSSAAIWLTLVASPGEEGPHATPLGAKSILINCAIMYSCFFFHFF